MGIKALLWEHGKEVQWAGLQQHRADKALSPGHISAREGRAHKGRGRTEGAKVSSSGRNPVLEDERTVSGQGALEVWRERELRFWAEQLRSPKGGTREKPQRWWAPCTLCVNQ